MTFNDKNGHLKTNENAISRNCHQKSLKWLQIATFI